MHQERDLDEGIKIPLLMHGRSGKFDDIEQTEAERW